MSTYSGFGYPAEIIAHAVYLYHRFALSFREVEEMLAYRGIDFRGPTQSLNVIQLLLDELLTTLMSRAFRRCLL